MLCAVGTVRGVLLAAAFLAGCAGPSARGTTGEGPIDAEAALARLLEGNARFAAGRGARPRSGVARRSEVAAGQAPIAAVLACADSRVAPEIVFDQGLGDLFVVRVAGNIADDAALGSLEYAAEHLHVPLIVVLGHERCGAVSAAVAGGEAEGHVKALVEAIRPAVDEARKGPAPADLVEAAVRANAVRVARILCSSEPVLKRLFGERRVEIQAARYDLDTGVVEMLADFAPADSVP